jgi:hypothetical protein
MRPLLAVLTLTVSCGAPAENPAAEEKIEAPPEADAKSAVKGPPPVKEPPPEALPGTAVDGKLMFQACADTHPCPDLLQAEGEKGCAALEISGTTGWRLPTKQEAERFSKVDGLLDLEGYHWTSTPFDQDDSQVWIVDPKSDQPTTIPRDRKPFRIRCVRDL